MRATQFLTVDISTLSIQPSVAEDGPLENVLVIHGSRHAEVLHEKLLPLNASIAQGRLSFLLARKAAPQLCSHRFVEDEHISRGQEVHEAHAALHLETLIKGHVEESVPVT
eukprot:CAMPEP_0170591614 /NCGR_PEP_ID=MMETSP0224-20130122/12494_1 /TAXON_ID=285029 /ORGANISM="Togula jolla, Strain CCCM 725" /LENGTH=110 /DNA_ID=CAMNT_0010915483 /DNA_START=599 /DNA_END=931 /DNA_ORIENTATION=-